MGGRPWEPGPRCDGLSAPPPPIRSDLELRWLTERHVAVLSDPTTWLAQQLQDHCGAYLAAMEQNRETVADWWAQMQYGMAAADIKTWAWPPFVAAFDDEMYRVGVCDGPSFAPMALAHWPQAIGETWVERPGVVDAPGARTQMADVMMVSYLELAEAPVSGEPFAIQDRYGNRIESQFDAASTISWAIKVDQVGFVPDGPKEAWLGAWMGPAGALPVSDFIGDTFSVFDEETGQLVYAGIVEAHRDAPALTGEHTLRLDFSSVETPGRYYVQLPRVGRSRTFQIRDDVVGEAFHTYARGLFHQRCSPLEEAHTAWHRGDIHQVFQGAFPPHVSPEDENDYGDHAA